MSSLGLLGSLRPYWIINLSNLLQESIKEKKKRKETVITGAHYQSTDNPRHILSADQGQNHTRWHLIQLKHTQYLSQCLMLRYFSNSKSLQYLLRLLKADLSLILSLLRVCVNNESQRLFLNLELSILPLAVYMDTYGYNTL